MSSRYLPTLVALVFLTGCRATNTSPVLWELSEHLDGQPGSKGGTCLVDPWTDHTVLNKLWTIEGDVAETLPAAVKAVEEHLRKHGTIVKRLGTSAEAEVRFNPAGPGALFRYYMYSVDGHGEHVLALHARPFPKERRLEVSLFGVEGF